MLIEVREEASSIVSRRCVVGDGVSHATQQRNVVPRHVDEEVSSGFVTNGWLEDFLTSTDGQPLLSSESPRGKEDAPVNSHALGVIVDEVGQQQTGRSDWR